LKITIVLYNTLSQPHTLKRRAIIYRPEEQFAADLDAKDPLRSFRDRFLIPHTPAGKEYIYFCGNSLGLQPRTVRNALLQELEDWGNLGVEGHFHAKNPWMPYHELLAASTARLVGANVDEVVVMNSLTVNLHLMMVSFYRPTTERYKILIESNAFPSDQYAVQSQLAYHGYDPAEALIELQPRAGESFLHTDDIEALLDREGQHIALILLGGVNYLSGQAFDMKRITRAGHSHGCVVGFDLAHAAGNLRMELHTWDVDFAVWCSYKYLNAGPGAVGGCFIHQRHNTNTSLPRFAGWWGHNKEIRFLMDSTFEPAAGADGWQLSNAPVLSMSALRASMEIFDEAGMDALQAKRVLLTGYLEFLLDQIPGNAVTIITPRDTAQRGAQLSLRLAGDGKKIFGALTENGIMCDWREPDVVRVAPVPLYNTFLEVHAFAQRFQTIIRSHQL